VSERKGDEDLYYASEKIIYPTNLKLPAESSGKFGTYVIIKINTYNNADKLNCK
jgi:hypothetical protein